MNFATLHVRLTRDCNAHCTYCSSAGVAAGRMSYRDFKGSIDFIKAEVFPRMGVGNNHTLTVEYLGGEVLTIPHEELEVCVNYAREKLRPMVRNYRDGAQSNLIGAKRRILDLHDLFRGNLGTSWDTLSDQRQVKGSAQLYRKMLENSLNHLDSERTFKPGRVIVLDKNNHKRIHTEVSDAIKNGYDLVIRPVFQGGSEDVNPANLEEITRALNKSFLIWKDHKERRIEPFYSLYHRRKSRGTSSQYSFAGCPFQSDCAHRSLSLDPDGSLYICQEMADSQHYPLGNAIANEFDEATWKLLARRTLKLSDDCTSCEWKSECGGGCMNEAIQRFGDPFAKTELCHAWKSIFKEIELEITDQPK